MALADLLGVRTRAQIETSIFATLTTAGFPVTSWQSGAIPRTLVRASATVLEHLYGLVGQVGAAAFLSTATGAWLTLHAASRFDVTRAAATFAEHSFTLAAASGSGPYTITPGQLVMTTASGRIFRSTNTANVTVPSGSTAPITVRCETAGSIGLTAPTIISSPALAGFTASYGALAVSGSNEESDASLRARCLAKWSTLGRGANLDAYEYIATTAPAAPTITRATVVPGSGDGTLTIYVAQSSAVASSPQVAAVQAYVDSLAPVTDDPTVVAASAANIQVVGTVAFTSASFNTTDARAAIEDAVTAYIVAAGGGDIVDLGGLYAAIYAAAEGIADVDLTLPALDRVLTASEVGVVSSITLTYSPS